ncbi:GFA family protein [Yoonia sp. 2307UL14-13]|uniref:GFA family protein n=1 Tax=Yoonia sp. 2307UL14-13 TaxID=3126506 RepID=UPI00309F7F77
MNRYRGTCHCQGVRFDVTLFDGLASARRCDCTLCRMRGGVAVSARLDNFKIVEGADLLSLYQFNTRVAKHYFCSRCGIYTHHQRRSNPDEYGVNVACLEGVSPFDFPEIPVQNGVVHPSDDPQAQSLAGMLRFTPTSTN